jgi:hypothetical protein
VRHGLLVVHVNKRDTTLGYTGPLSSAPSKTVTVIATLVDKYGQPVVGKKVTFQLGSQPQSARPTRRGRSRRTSSSS